MKIECKSEFWWQCTDCLSMRQGHKPGLCVKAGHDMRRLTVIPTIYLEQRIGSIKAFEDACEKHGIKSAADTLSGMRKELEHLLPYNDENKSEDEVC